MTSSSAPQFQGEAEQVGAAGVVPHAAGAGGAVDPRALCAEVYAQFQHRVRAEIRSRLRSGTDESLVLDVHQTVFLKLCKRVHAEKSLPPDVLGVLLDLAKDEVKSQRRSLARRRVDSEPDEDLLPASKPDPEAQMVAAEKGVEERRILGLIFAEMRQDAAEAIRMFDLEGLSYQDAAERLGCSVSTFKGRLQKARESFHEVRGRVLARLHEPGSRKPVPRRVKPPLRVEYGGSEGAVLLVAASAGRQAVYHFQVSTDQERWNACPDVMRCRTLVTGLSVGTMAYFRVQTRTPNGLSAWSAVVGFVVR